MKIQKTFFFGFVLTLCAMGFLSAQSLDHRQRISILVKEPSDVAFSALDQTLYIVSDNGKLYQTDLSGNLLRFCAEEVASDFEGVLVLSNRVLVSDERNRRILIYDTATLELLRTVSLTYHGAMNRGFEAIAFDEETKHFYLFTEKDPLLLYEFDEDFELINVIAPEGINEVSACSWYDESLWVLSDDDRTLYRLNEDFSIASEWKLKVVNPEGFCFDDSGNLYVVSDDMELLYLYDSVEVVQ